MGGVLAERRSVWVTGAEGFLGAPACERLGASGHLVERIVHRPAASPESAAAGATGGHASSARPRAAPGAQAGPKPPLLACDLAEERLQLADDQAPPATIVHLAASIPTTFEGAASERVAARNRRIDDNVFTFASEVGAAIVFASSGSVYGEASGRVFREDGPTDPRGPYAEAKLRSERRGAEVLGDAGLPFAALRISAPYGPGQPTRTVVEHFLREALAGEALTYHGTGSRMQDFIYVTDVADAIVACVDAGAAGVFNVASGRPVTMRQLAALVAEIVGGDVVVRASGRPDPQEGRSANYEIEAAERAFGWRPATSLKEGLQRWRDTLQTEA
jgi:UDP-glucose 4-epimerase